MPCSDGRERIDAEQREREYQLLVAFACGVLRRMERQGLDIPPAMAAWWAEHKAHDAEQGRG